MEISNSITGYQISLERIRNTLLDSLRNGQILQARALTSTQNKQIQLRIGKIDILAHTQARIAAGDNLTLQVIRASNPLQLKVMQEIAPQRIQAEAMRAALPHQASVAHLMKNLSTLAPLHQGSQHGYLTQKLKQAAQHLPVVARRMAAEAKPTARTQIMARPQASSPTRTAENNKLHSAVGYLLQGQDGAKLSEAISRILSFQVAPDEKLSAQRLRLAFEHSGLFLESGLVAGGGPPNDMKRGILELLLQLRPLLAAAQATQQPVPSKAIDRAVGPIGLLAELVSQAEGSLARILFNQLSSLPGDNASQQIWQFELPFRHGEKCDSFRVQIERETKQNEAGKPETRWSVKLDFDLEPIGTVHATLALIGEEVSSRFTAEHAETARRLELALPHLASAFFRAGLKVGTLSATRGAIDKEPRPRFPLLDEKA